MDKAVLDNKFESLRRCIQRIRDKTPESVEELLADIDLQDIISVNLERAVQISVDIASHILAESNDPVAQTMSEGFAQLSKLGIIPEKLAVRMKKVVGFRNISVHAYQSIDWEIVYHITQKNLADFVDFVRYISKKLEESHH